MCSNIDRMRGRDGVPVVSVVVPTIGRPELLRALRSVRAQRTSARIELIVVHDGADGIELPAEVYELSDSVIRTSGRLGGSRARNLGIEHASGEVVALLDDDDEWLPNKVDIQLSLLKGATDPARTVIAGRQICVSPGDASVFRPGPDRLIRPGEPVEHYLFRHRSPSGGRPVIYTSTLLCSRSMAVEVPWDESLARHQDWDWLIRLGRLHGAEIIQAPEPVSKIFLGSASSISATTDWRASLEWADRMLKADAAVYADFLVAQPLRYALTARSWVGVRTVLAALRSCKRLPAAGPAAIGLAGILPRREFERMTVRIGGIRSR